MSTRIQNISDLQHDSEWLRKFYPIPAVIAGVVATITFLLITYVGFAFAPATTGSGLNGLPTSQWLGRFDMAQLFGTLVDPPYPTTITWLIGLVIEGGLLITLSAAFCLTLSWAVIRPTPVLGAAFGASIFAIFGLFVWIAPGLQPAVMRGAIPDTGFFMLGWSGWASCTLLIASLAYGLVTSTLYALLTRGFARR